MTNPRLKIPIAANSGDKIVDEVNIDYIKFLNRLPDGTLAKKHIDGLMKGTGAFVGFKDDPRAQNSHNLQFKGHNWQTQSHQLFDHIICKDCNQQFFKFKEPTPLAAEHYYYDNKHHLVYPNPNDEIMVQYMLFHFITDTPRIINCAKYITKRNERMEARRNAFIKDDMES